MSTANWRLNSKEGFILKSDMAKARNKVTTVTKKSLQYSIITKVVNFDPNKLSSKTIIVDGKLAVHLKGRVYTEIKA